MGRSVGRLVGGCMAVLVRRRVVDRCVMGCCSWNICTVCLTYHICYGADLAKHPFDRTFGDPAPDEWSPYYGGILEWPWLGCCLQIPCAVDCVVGPILVNAADCCVTCCCDDSGAESCCCVACAGGLKQFDRLHWSLWDYSPFRCCPYCSGVEPYSDEKWKEKTFDTYFGTKHC